MKTLAFIILASAMLVGCTSRAISAKPKDADNYSKRILGRWLGPKNKFRIFHSDGTWGVQRHETATEGIGGRRWRINGENLTLIYPTDNGVGTPVHMITATYTIVSFTAKSFTIEADGYNEVYEWAP